MTDLKNRSFLFAVHDAAPAHLDNLIRAEELIEELKIPKVCYLLVPDFHNLGQSHLNLSFVEWCRKPRNFQVEWFLHGYSHIELETDKPEKLTSIKDLGRRAYYKGGEAEFMGLNSENSLKRILDGQEIFSRCTGIDKPAGFVAPAWFFHPGLFDILKKNGYGITEDHRYLYFVYLEKKIYCPVITWATRTLLWRTGSLYGCPLLELLWRKEPQIRIAVHPHDFEYSVTISSIRNLIRKAMNRRTCLSYGELLKDISLVRCS